MDQWLRDCDRRHKIGDRMAGYTRTNYEKAARISLKAYRENLTLREAALKLGFVTAGQFDEWVRPQDMTHPLAPQTNGAAQARRARP